MARTRSLAWSQLKIGILAVVALVLAIMIVLAVGGQGGFAWERYELKTKFPSAKGLRDGAVVRVAGVDVGKVTGVALDPEAGYQAEVSMAIDRAANLPGDSSAAITSEGLLGRSYIALIPGGSGEPLADNDVILDTQGAIDMMALVGSLINDSGGDDAGGGGDIDTMSDEFVAPPAADAP